MRVGSKFSPTDEEIDSFEVKAIFFLQTLKDNFWTVNNFKDYEHILVKHAPTILKVSSHTMLV
jgi:hypothetical protein